MGGRTHFLSGETLYEVHKQKVTNRGRLERFYSKKGGSSEEDSDEQAEKFPNGITAITELGKTFVLFKGNMAYLLDKKNTFSALGALKCR